MAAKKLIEDPEKVADDFTSEEIASNLEATLEDVSSIRRRWPGQVQLPDGDRRTSIGRLITQIGPPLRVLFAAITPDAGDSEAERKAKAKLAEVFHNVLGAQDYGRDDKRFEVELLDRRLQRAEAEQKIIEALDAARDRFADDLLNTGELVLGPGLQALEIARTIADKNPEYRSLLAPVTSALGSLTKRARQHQEAARKGQKKSEEPAPAEEKGKEKGEKGEKGGGEK